MPPSPLLLLLLLLALPPASPSPPNPPRSAVLVHGYHCDAAGWERVVWGDPRTGRLGRIPLALRLSLARPSTVAILFGSAASTHAPSGAAEGEAALALALSRAPRLAADFPRHFSREDAAAAAALLAAAGAPLLGCADTRAELRAAARVFRRRRVGWPLLVSSPTHLPRCVRDAPAAFAREGYCPARHGGVLMAAQSDTSYEGACPADVAIVEPPHRPDRTSTAHAASSRLALHRLVARTLRVPPARRRSFERGLDELLRRHSA